MINRASLILGGGETPLLYWITRDDPALCECYISTIIVSYVIFGITSMALSITSQHTLLYVTGCSVKTQHESSMHEPLYNTVSIDPLPNA